jgi:hypothetical protein
MACRGVHFALTAEQERQLLALLGQNDAVVELVQEEIEHAWDREWLCETDKAWDAIHRCLTDGNLALDNGAPPLNLVIFGGRQLCDSGDYYVCFVDRATVPQVATALNEYTRAEFDIAYDRLVQTDYAGPHNNDDREYTWVNIEELKPFWAKAAEAGRSVIFTVDQ